MNYNPKILPATGGVLFGGIIGWFVPMVFIVAIVIVIAAMIRHFKGL